MRLPGRHRTGAEDHPLTSPAPQPGDWKSAALETTGLVWLRIDAALRVVEASASALDFFERPSLPGSVIAVTRSPAIEDRARDVLAGQAGRRGGEVAHCATRLRNTQGHARSVQ